MKIGVVILSRANPTGLICAIKSMHALATGENEIKYYVRYDDDDEQSYQAIDMLDPIPIAHVIAPRPITLGEAMNQAGAIAYEDGVDALSFWCDDIFAMCKAWDHGIKTMIVDRKFDVFCWRELNFPTAFTLPVISRKYFRATDRLWPEWFPFWFLDTWLGEVYELARGQPPAIVADMVAGGNPVSTMNMREVAFWVDFWKATQILRVQEAAQVRRNMGWPEIDLTATFAKLKRLLDSWNPEAIEAARRIDFGPPSERYLIAKERASAWLAREVQTHAA